MDGVQRDEQTEKNGNQPSPSGLIFHWIGFGFLGIG
jgi:hypothetical protein